MSSLLNISPRKETQAKNRIIANLALLINSNGWSYEQAARKLGVTRDFVYKICTHKRSPSAETIGKISLLVLAYDQEISEARGRTRE